MPRKKIQKGQLRIDDSTDLKKIGIELVRCKKSCSYFISNYIVIQHPTRGKLLFKLWDFQEDVLKSFLNHRFNIILKARQLGISTLIAAYALWLATFHNDKSILCMATKADVAKNIIKKVDVMIKGLPLWLRPELVDDNKFEKTFVNRSSIKAIGTTEESGRSEALSLLILDEAAFIDQRIMETVWGAASHTLSTGGDCIVCSTPNGVGNWFHKTFVDAEARLNEFYPMTLHWSVHPEHTIEWRKQQDLIDPKLAAQECFDGETRIFTKNGYKKIKDIKIGDMVLTHNGRFKRVTKLYNKRSSNLFKIKSFLNDNISYVTKNHPFLCNNKFQEISNINNNELLPIITNNIEYDNEKTILDLYDIIKPKYFKKKLCNDGNSFYINDRKNKVVHNRYISVDYDLGYIIGIYLSEGTCDRLRFWVSHHVNEKETWVKELIKIIQNKFGLKQWQQRFNIEINNGAQTTFCSEILCNTIKMFVDGDLCYNKKLSEFAYKNGNIEFFKGVLDATYIGDATMSCHNYKHLGVTSKDMIYDMKFILHLLGINSCSFRNHYKDNICKGHSLKILNSHKIEINGKITNLINNDKLNQTRYFSYYNSDENYTYSQIIKDDFSEEIDVYNLEIEEDNSYVTEHFIVHNCDVTFVTSGDNVIDLKFLKENYEKHIRKPKYEELLDRGLHIWEPPSIDHNCNYVIVADIATGDGTDYCAAVVLKISEIEKDVIVATYKGKIKTDDFGIVLDQLGRNYHNALLVIENVGVGHSTITKVMELNYPNLYYTPKGESYNYDYINNLADIEKVKFDGKPGFTTSQRTRPAVIGKLINSIMNQTVEFFDRRIITELETFIYKNGRAQARHGYNDDLIMSLAIALWVRDIAYKIKMIQGEKAKAALENYSYVSSSMPIIRSSNYETNPYIIQVREGQMEDISWLFKK